jgi:antitoxin (DNA-binding transcriptional repressor) of toxin-antitoxin stability system
LCYHGLMLRIGVRELRQHASRYLDMIKTGETVEVTERGELVALLVPPSPAVAARDRLLAAGRLVPAKAPFQPPARRLGSDRGVTASKVLAELREE